MKINLASKEVPIENLRWRCDLNKLTFKDTCEVKACDEIIGQERALKAIRLGLEIEGMGYNVFVTGLAGTGRTTTIKCLLEEIDKKKKLPDDICYVNNFQDPDTPRAILLKPGLGKKFKRDMNLLIESMKKNIPEVFESEGYQKKQKNIVESLREKGKDIFKELEKKLSKEGFTTIQVQPGQYLRLDIAPLVKEKPINIDELEKITEEGKFSKEEFKRLKEKYKEFSTDLLETINISQKIEKEIRENVDELNKKTLLPLVENAIFEIKVKYKNKKIDRYLEDVKTDILENFERFVKDVSQSKHSPFRDMPPKETFNEYRVNVLIDNSEVKGSPIIIETNPTYKNLFGTIERVLDRSGVWQTDFTRIKAGSFLKANNGYLVINALDAMIESGVWQTLKRTLRNRVMEIQSYDPFYMASISALKPEPIEVNVKVVMIGDNYLYHLLYNHDDDFKKIFKVKAEFDSEMDKKEESIAQYTTFVSKICIQDNLLPFDNKAIGAIIEYGVRLAGKQFKISIRFNKIEEIVKEANFWAKKNGRRIVTEEYVDEAIKEKYNRVRLTEDKLQEMIDRGTLMIDTDGMVVGQVNGLSVYDTGDYSFGIPTRITAKTSMGRDGIINIEREADLSGKTHNKGVLILEGYLRSKYAQDKPLTLSSSLCFEQSYGGVDGDSASSTEVYAILSSLSELPLRQDIAVTGSVNQKGEIQPIGGVNQKIEGFYDACKAKGLTGKQGVMIPHLNIENLALRKDIVKAVEEKKFHVYSVKNIDGGIEILTGVKAGKIQKDGTYQKGSVNYLVNQKLMDLAMKMKKFGEKKKK
ncbi:MAG TPA: AAA family ATPase [Nitrospinota bacterium]|nr:AAA family ATPase [Nitrospinota bacterium]